MQHSCRPISNETTACSDAHMSHIHSESNDPIKFGLFVPQAEESWVSKEGQGPRYWKLNNGARNQSIA